MEFIVKKGQPKLKESAALYLKRLPTARECISEFFKMVNQMHSATKKIDLVIEGVGMRIGGISSNYTLIYQDKRVYAIDLQNKNRYGIMHIKPVIQNVKLKIFIEDGKQSVQVPYSDVESIGKIEVELPKGFNLKEARFRFEIQDSNGNLIEMTDELNDKCKQLVELFRENLELLPNKMKLI